MSDTFLIPMKARGSRWYKGVTNEHFRWETRRAMGLSNQCACLWFHPTAAWDNDWPIFSHITTAASYIGWSVLSRPTQSLRLRWGADEDRRSFETLTNIYELNKWNFMVVNLQRDGNATLWINDMTTPLINEVMSADAAIDWGNGPTTWMLGISSSSVSMPMKVAQCGLIIGNTFSSDDRAELYGGGRGIRFNAMSAGLKTKFSTTEDFFELRERSGDPINAVTGGASRSLHQHSSSTRIYTIGYSGPPRRA